MTVSKVMAVSEAEIASGLHQYKWHKVALPTMFYDHDAVVDWLNKCCSKRVRFLCALFLFEDANDATLFTLRWA